MRRRMSVRSRVVNLALRAAMRLSSGVRNAGLPVLLTGLVLAAATVWLASAASAHMQALKSWERLFGVSTRQPANAGAQPLGTGGISGYSSTILDAPGAGTSAATGTIAASIDASGDVAGTYLDAEFVGHGFYRAASGTFTAIDASGAGTSAKQGTFAVNMDPTGSYIAGMYADSNNSYHGFVRAADGTITSFDAGTVLEHQGTIATSVNSSGTVTGTYTAGSFQGFVRTSDGTITLFDAPDAGSGSTPQGTIPMSVNASGTITGFYVSSTGVPGGFVRSASGALTEFQVPCQGSTCYATVPFSIDAAGDIVGTYGATGESTQLGHGFIRSADGTFTTFDPTGSAIGSSSLGGVFGGTLPLNIDPTGTYVTGFYSDASNGEHGFIRTSSGITSFDAAGASTTGVLQLNGTGAGGVNASGAIVGAYTDSSDVFHGLLLTPTATGGFTLSASPGSISVAQSSTGTSTITVTDTGGFTGTVSLAAGGLPSGVTASFAAGSEAGTQTLTLTASASAAVTASPVTVTITGTSGALTANTTVALTITAEPSFTAGTGGTTAMTVTPGATSGNTGTISLVATNGFSGAVDLTCKVTTTMTSVTDMPACSLNPTSVTLSGTTAQTSTLTVTTTAASSAANPFKKLFTKATGGTALALIVLLAVPKRRRNWPAMLGLVLLAISLSATGCGGGGNGGGGAGGGGNSGTTAGAYTITVTGTAGTVSATVGTVTLTVQ